MENRERDRVSQRREPTEAGELNRDVSERIGRETNGGTAEFGQSIGRSENLEGGEMRNRNENENMNDRDRMGGESSRRSGSSDYGSSSGRGSKISPDQNIGRRDSTESMDKSRSQSDVRDRGDSSEGRH